MPQKPKRLCNKGGCFQLALNGEKYCEAHLQLHKEKAKSHDKERGSAHQRGYDSKWRKARIGFLTKNPFCIFCREKGIIKPATVVDHIIPHKGDKKLFWDKTNWQPLCKQCHDRKTVKEDGGFGVS